MTECEVTSCSPIWLTKTLNYFVLLGQVNLNLLPEVEDGAVPGCAEHLLMQAALAPLALRPQL